MALLTLQVMLHRLGQQQAADQCILQEDQPACFLELAATNDGAYITINSNAKTASEVGRPLLTYSDTYNEYSRVLCPHVILCPVPSYGQLLFKHLSVKSRPDLHTRNSVYSRTDALVQNIGAS